MSHHFRAKRGTFFNFNSDMSGRVHVLSSQRFPGSEGEIDAADLLEFVDWYRRTPGYGLDEEAAAETLTAEEREALVEYVDEQDRASVEVAKLLRIHDALQARVGELTAANHASKDLRQEAQHRCQVLEGEIDALQKRTEDLERKLMESYDDNRDLRARNRELEPL